MSDPELEAALRRHAELERFAAEYGAFGDVAIEASRFRAVYRYGRHDHVAELAAFDALEAALDELLATLERFGVGDAAT